jgi:hypothetical protein
MITKTKDGEMWGYNKVSREIVQSAVGKSSGIDAGVLAGAGGSSAGVLGGVGGGYGKSSQESQRIESTTTVFLLLHFDDNDINIDYKLSATKF